MVEEVEGLGEGEKRKENRLPIVAGGGRVWGVGVLLARCSSKLPCLFILRCRCTLFILLGFVLICRIFPPKNATYLKPVAYSRKREVWGVQRAHKHLQMK